MSNKRWQIYQYIQAMSIIRLPQNQEQFASVQQKNSTQLAFFGLIDRVGSFGRYQKITVLFWALIIYFSGQLLFSVPFLFFQDPYICYGIDPSINCKDYVCGLSPNQREQYFPHVTTIKSLASQLGDYRCPAARDELDNLIAIMFFGIAAGYLLLTLFGELVGKKMLMLINLFLFIAGLAVVLAFPGDWAIVASGLSLAVLGISNCYLICFMFLVETVERTSREKSTIFIQSFYGIGAVVNIFWYWLFQDWWTIFFACYLIPAVLLFIGICLLVVDTPMSLALRNTPQIALKKMLFIAKMNGVEQALTLEDIENARKGYLQGTNKTQVRKVTVIQIFKYKSTRYLTLLLILLQCTISFEFYAPSMMLSSFHFDIYINGLALASSQVLANFTAAFVISRFKRRLLSFACFGCTLLASVVLIFLWDQSQQTQATLIANIFILVLLFLFQLSIAKQYSVFYVFANEAFPTQARVIAVSLISLMGGLMTTVTAKVVGLCLQNNFPVMIVFSALSGLCIFIVFLLPQTFQSLPKDVIDELHTPESNIDNSETLSKSLLNH